MALYNSKSYGKRVKVCHIVQRELCIKCHSKNSNYNLKSQITKHNLTNFNMWYYGLNFQVI